MSAGDDSLSVLAEAYTAFRAMRRDLEADLMDEQAKLKAAYRAAITPPGRGTGGSNMPLDDADEESRPRLIEAERVAVHGVHVALAMNRSSEREIRDYEYVIDQQRRRFEQLLRMRQRGPLGRRPKPAAPRSVEPGVVNGGDVICALCGRDFWSPPGTGLVIADSDPREPSALCWICGDEHAPEITANMLAEAVRVEGRIPGSADYCDHWISLLRDMGMQQRAIDLEEALDAAKTMVREMKAAGLGRSETWLDL